MKHTFIIAVFFSLCLISEASFSDIEYSKFIYKPTKDSISGYEKILLNITRAMSYSFNKFDNSYAIIISIGNYDTSPMRSPKLDAEKIKNYLISTGEYDEIVMLQDEDATYEAVRYFMHHYFQKKMKEGTKNRLLFYFSGHGTQHKGPDDQIIGSLLLKESTGSIDDLNLIDMRQIEAWADRLWNANHILFLIDACFSGLAGTEVKATRVYDTTVRPSELIEKNSRFLIASGEATQESLGDPKRWGGSLFTDALISGLEGNADKSPIDSIVTIYELYTYVKRAVDNESGTLGKDQTPVMTSLSNDNGTYFFLVPQTQSNSNNLEKTSIPSLTLFSNVHDPVVFINGQKLYDNSLPLKIPLEIKKLNSYDIRIEKEGYIPHIEKFKLKKSKIVHAELRPISVLRLDPYVGKLLSLPRNDLFEYLKKNEVISSSCFSDNILCNRDVFDRLCFSRGRKGDDEIDEKLWESPTTSSNSFKNCSSCNKVFSNNHKAIFEYLGDTIGLSFQQNYNLSNHEFTGDVYKSIDNIIDTFGSEKSVELFGHHVFDTILYILEEIWSRENEKVALHSALQYVLSQTEKNKIDFQAKLNPDKTFINEQYEKEWNGIQKFFYRLEKRIPGVASFVRMKLENYLSNN